MPVITTTITPFTHTPSRENPLTFSSDMDSRLGEENSRITEMNSQSSEMNDAVEIINDNIVAIDNVSDNITAVNTVASNISDVYVVAVNITDIQNAEENADIAVAARDAAVATANVTQWVSGTSYSLGQNTFSPIDFQTYRANTATSGTTDPSLSSDWTAVGITPAAQQTALNLKANLVDIELGIALL